MCVFKHSRCVRYAAAMRGPLSRDGICHPFTAHPQKRVILRFSEDLTGIARHVLMSSPLRKPLGQNFSIFQKHESDDDSYEVLDLTEYARRHHWWNRVFGRNSGPIVEKYSVATQIVMGGVTGWCAGFLFQKVGKLAATAVGGGFLLLQIASHSGYVQVDWKRVEKDVNKAKKQLKKRANKAAPEINTLIEESTEFIKQNIVVSSGFVGGFLLGLAS
ncbi:FUN14 domain-containing protein 1 [Egretta garzetta]|uniref:FUN14 domain-containing protein 1 n=1 Tax=Egretta garzetta TaxID=188379 RepID=UPI00163D1664|nr:FUN14 domain-containing protein 1 [Egretta garzetta]